MGEMPGHDLLVDGMETARQAFLIDVRKRRGSPMTEGEYVTAKLAFVAGYMAGAQGGAYLLYLHQAKKQAASSSAAQEGGGDAE